MSSYLRQQTVNLAKKVKKKSSHHLRVAKREIKQLFSDIRNKHNVIIIGVDTLRADHLNCYGYTRPTSPNLNQLARQSILFTNVYSTSSWTVPAWMSLFTGCLPSRHRLIQFPDPGRLSDTIPTLAELVSAAGYLTVGFHGGGYVSEGFGFKRGFLSYESYGARFEDNMAACFRWLERHRQWRFLLFWHGFNCHRPYDPPRQFDTYYTDYDGSYDVSKLYMPDGQLPETETDVQHIIAKYDGEINYVDFLIGKLLGKLESLDLLDKSILIVTSDHGEEFLEHGGFDHTRTLYEELVRVPLIVRLPGYRKGRISSHLISLVDLAPAILAWTDLPSISGPGPGVSELLLSPRACVFAATGYQRDYLERSEKWLWQHKTNRPELLRSIRNQNWKLLLDYRDDPVELYNLKHDPAEKQNRIESDWQIVDELLGDFWKFGSEEPADRLLETVEMPGEFDAIITERLRGLGYL